MHLWGVFLWRNMNIHVYILRYIDYRATSNCWTKFWTANTLSRYSNNEWEPTSCTLSCQEVFMLMWRKRPSDTAEQFGLWNEFSTVFLPRILTVKLVYFLPAGTAAVVHWELAIKHYFFWDRLSDPYHLWRIQAGDHNGAKTPWPVVNPLDHPVLVFLKQTKPF